MVHRNVRRLFGACVGVALGALVATAPANAGAATSKGVQHSQGIEASQDLAASSICTSLSYEGTEYGGRRYCEFQVGLWSAPWGTHQVFVVGTDYAVWTRWHDHNGLSPWTTLGGEVKHNDFRSVWMTPGPTVNAFGTDGRHCQRTREDNGNCTDWSCS